MEDGLVVNCDVVSSGDTERVVGKSEVDVCGVVFVGVSVGGDDCRLDVRDDAEDSVKGVKDVVDILKIKDESAP